MRCPWHLVNAGDAFASSNTYGSGARAKHLLLAQYNETQSTDNFALQNSKLLKVSLTGNTIQAKIGSMVAYQGDATFEHAGSGGMSRMLKKAVTGEGQELMKISGTGEVFLADQAQDIHLLYLEGEKITVNGPTCSPSTLTSTGTSSASRARAAMMGGGLYNTALQGTGLVAILSDGPPVLLNVASAPTFADAQAAITWSGRRHHRAEDRLQDEEPDRHALGRVVQMAFRGTGWVLVQPSRAGSPRRLQPRRSGGGLGNLLGG